MECSIYVVSIVVIIIITLPIHYLFILNQPIYQQTIDRRVQAKQTKPHVCVQNWRVCDLSAFPPSLPHFSPPPSSLSLFFILGSIVFVVLFLKMSRTAAFKTCFIGWTTHFLHSDGKNIEIGKKLR